MNRTNFIIHCGDALGVLTTLPSESVNCCVTSPPYFNLRDYGVEGQIGQEGTPEQYSQRLVSVFREVRRVLADDGTLWINISDSYARSGKGRNADGTHKLGGKQGTNKGRVLGKLHKTPTTPGIKSKDLIGIPWMLGFALRADGWYLRSEILWSKRNPTPESVKDRPTKAHEQIVLLSKSAKYYYDTDAIKEPLAESSRLEIGGKRNCRTVWTITPKPYKGAHFAVFPPELPKTCLLAGCPKDGVVLDPFSGAATTGIEAVKNSRSYIGIELNPEYVRLSNERYDAFMSGEHRIQKERTPLKEVPVKAASLDFLFDTEDAA